ncbi:MAG: preprotein translocase subunit SecE [Candidatus Promineifilaceae bacterium]
MTENSGGSNALTQYLREARGEIRKVTWPTRDEASRWTGIVLLVTAVMTVILSSADYLFSQGLSFLVDSFLGIGG